MLERNLIEAYSLANLHADQIYKSLQETRGEMLVSFEKQQHLEGHT